LKCWREFEFDFDERGEPELPMMISDKDLTKVVPYAWASRIPDSLAGSGIEATLRGAAI